MSIRRLSVIVFVIFNLLCSGAAGEKIKLRLATGSKTGVYYPIGMGIKKVIEQAYPDKVEIQVLETGGSLSNLGLIDKEQADLALVQNDSAYYFSHGQAMFNLPSKRAQAIASLYTEYIQIVTTKKSDITYLSQLKGRRIRTGSPPENVANNGTIILALAGWEASDLTDVRCKFGEARDMMLSNSLDAAFLTAGIPTPLMTETIDGVTLQDHVNLIPIGESLANRLTRAFPYLVYTEIPPRTYNKQEMAVKTVGVRAILVARKNVEFTKFNGGSLPDDFIVTLTKLIFDKDDIIVNEHGVEGSDISKHKFELRDGLYGILDHRMRPIIPIHPAARAFYTEKGLMSKTLSDYFPAIVWSSITIVCLFYIIKYRSTIRRITQRHIHLRLFITFVCLFVLGTLAMFFCERNNNRSFESIGESFWSITIYVLSGFEDRYPVTVPGRIISILIFILSVFFFGAVAGRFAAAFLKREETKMPRDVNDHIVICNWNERGRRVLAELRHPEGKPDADVIIVDNTMLNEKEMRSIHYNNVYFIQSDPIRHGTLKKAKVGVADTVIILADGHSPDPDAKSAMIILALLSEARKKRPHIITEVVNIDNSQHLKDAGADETICTTEIGVGILAHCALNKQLSVVYKDLLTYSFEGNEIYIIQPNAYPEEFVGKSFGQCAQMLYQHRDDSNPVVLLGIRRGDNVLLNPRRMHGGIDDGECIVQENDALIAMAFRAPDLKAVFKP